VTTDDGGSENQIGGPPPVLLAALGAALLIAVGLVAAFASLRGDDSAEPAAKRPATTQTVTTDDRVLLLVYAGGSGFGRVQITPSDVSCNAACEYKFTEDTRVTATVDPASGSTFEGWGDACRGKERCSFVMDRPRTLSATFATETTTVDPLCEGVAPADRDPTCPPPEEGTDNEPVVPGPDCEDARDNDDDGLTDSAQDPDCETTGSEGGTSEPGGTSPRSDTPPPPPSLAPNECLDGEDNDGDGLTDRAQDPDCEKGRSESG
jgi:hypothetical protein